MVIKKNKPLQRVLATLIVLPIVWFIAGNDNVVYASKDKTPKLFWQSMEMNDVAAAQSQAVLKPAIQKQQPQDNVINLIASMQEQQQSMAAVLAALQPQSKKNDSEVVTALQMQQQQFMATLMQMQQQQQQNMMLMINAMQQNKNDTAAALAATQQQQQETQFALLLKLLGNKTMDNGMEYTPLEISTLEQVSYRPVEITPILDAPEPQGAAYQRIRLAPPEEVEPSRSPADFITEAVQDAALEGYYKDSMAVFNYGDTALYKIYCKEGYLTLIRLQPGESIVSINGGDTTRWVVDNITAGTGETMQAQVMLKPVRSGLDTNFVIITDKHTYQIQAKSTSWYNPVVSWTYPHEEKAQRYQQEERLLKLEQDSLAVGTQRPDQLNFNYKVSTRGKVDAWKPTTVFDDGQKVYIKMTDAMKYGEAPALLLRDNRGKTILVNYRMKNNYYIVDRLFKEAELRLGTKEWVRIKRVGDFPGEE